MHRAIEIYGRALEVARTALLSESFPDAHLHLDPLGPVTAGMTNALEGAWFSLCLAARRRWRGAERKTLPARLCLTF